MGAILYCNHNVIISYSTVIMSLRIQWRHMITSRLGTICVVHLQVPRLVTVIVSAQSRGTYIPPLTVGCCEANWPITFSQLAPSPHVNYPSYNIMKTSWPSRAHVWCWTKPRLVPGNLCCSCEQAHDWGALPCKSVGWSTVSLVLGLSKIMTYFEYILIFSK